MERFDAYTLYKLIFNSWHRKTEKKIIQAWENGEGEPLQASNFRDKTSIVGLLQNLIMPIITEGEISYDGGVYLRPLQSGWQNMLTECNDYVSNPKHWQPFWIFRGKISELLFYYYPGGPYLNKKYKTLIEKQFDENEIPSLLNAMQRLTENLEKGRQAIISPDQAKLLLRAKSAFGELMIGELGFEIKLKDVTIPMIDNK